jgi:hypothetical protein
MHWKQAKTKSGIANGRIALEDRHDATEHNDDKYWVFSVSTIDC